MRVLPSLAAIALLFTPAAALAAADHAHCRRMRLDGGDPSMEHAAAAVGATAAPARGARRAMTGTSPASAQPAWG